MEQRMYQGQIDPEQLAQALVDEWDQGDTVAQAFGAQNEIVVQIGQREAGFFSDEPNQALTLGIEQTADGVRVMMGQQRWYKDSGVQVFTGGFLGFFPFFFTFPLGSIFGGGDDIDQRLPARIWQSVERFTAQRGGAATGQTQRLNTITCPHCGVVNPEGAQRCSACGGSLAVQPVCPSCGHTNPIGASFCNQCGTQLGVGAVPVR